MSEANTKSNGNSKPPQNAEPTSKEENQQELNEEARFFHPIQLSEESGETLDEKEIEKSKVEIEQRLQEFLKNINEETLQLSEFLMEENKLVSELCMSLKQILKKINVSFTIPPQNLPLKKNVKKAILNEEGHLILVHEKDEMHSAFLAEYPPEIVMAVLWETMPELAKVITLHKKKISTRVNFFERIKKELKSIVSALGGTKDGNTESDEEQIMDVAKESSKNEDTQHQT